MPSLPHGTLLLTSSYEDDGRTPAVFPFSLLQNIWIENEEEEEKEKILN